MGMSQKEAWSNCPDGLTGHPYNLSVRYMALMAASGIVFDAPVVSEKKIVPCVPRAYYYEVCWGKRQQPRHSQLSTFTAAMVFIILA